MSVLRKIETFGARTRDAVVRRWSRTTRRERQLLAILALACPVMLAAGALDWRAKQQDSYAQAEIDLDAARRDQAVARRVLRASADDALLADMATWGIDASNEDVARAIVEKRLNSEVARAGLTQTEIRMDGGVTEVGVTRWIGAEVQSDLRWGPVFAFLDGLTAWPEGFRITVFRYEMTPPAVVGRRIRANDRANNRSDPAPAPPAGRVKINLEFPLRDAAAQQAS